MAANSHSLDLESGSSQYASITDASQTGLDITGDMTVEGWFKAESLSSAMTLISKYNTNSQRSWRVNAAATTGNLIFSVSSNGTAASSIGTNFGQAVVGQWVHFAFVYDASAGSCKAYINGVLLGDNTGLPTSIYDSSAAFAIGCYFATATPTEPTDGLIDEVRVWNDVRTSQEIIDNMYQDVTGQANLQGYWKLNNDYTDSSANGNDLTASGSPVFSTTVPFPTYTAVRQSALSATSLASDANLVSYYKLDADGTDTQGTHNLTAQGTLTYPTGLFGNGVSQGTTNSDNALLYKLVDPGFGAGTNTPFSISGWVKFNTATTGIAYSFFNWCSNNTFTRFGKTTANVFVFYRVNQTVQQGPSFACAPEVDTWYHVAMTYDGTNVRGYVNGVYIGLVAASGTRTTAETEGIGIGVDGQAFDTLTNTDEASFDDVSFWSDALSDQEVLDIYTGTATAGGNFFLMF